MQYLLLVAAATAFHTPPAARRTLTMKSALTTVEPRFAPMPAPLRSDVPGTWAYDTMSRRVVEEILDRVVYGDNGGAPIGPVYECSATTPSTADRHEKNAKNP